MRTCSHCGATAGPEEAACLRCGAALPRGEHEASASEDVFDADAPSGFDPTRIRTAPAENIDPTGIACVTCGYDVSGTAVGGVCPECGTPVLRSIPRVDGANAPAAPEQRLSSAAAWSAIVGALSVGCCVPAGFIAIALGVQAFWELWHRKTRPESAMLAVIGTVLGVIAVLLLLERVF